MPTGQEQATLQGHENGIRGLAFSPDGKTLVTGSMDMTVRLWDVATRKEKMALEGTSARFSLSRSPQMASWWPPVAWTTP
ncbi:MAG: hypothetical protein NVSMB62_16840 [Acidobacteriaceae bacterium]